MRSGDARAANVERRWHPFWNAYFGLALIGTLSILALQSDTPFARGIAVGLLLILTVAYLIIGRQVVRRFDDPDWKTWLYIAIMIVCFVPATVIVPAAAFGLGALIPQLYMSVPQRYAGALTAVLMSGVGYRWLTGTALDSLVAGLVLIVLLGCAGVTGAMIGWMGDQNDERARLIVELDRTRAELAEANRQAGILAERERIAGDIHDTVGQDLGAISMLIQAAESETGPSEHLQAARQSAKNSLAEVRALVGAMTPPALVEGDLLKALEDLAAGCSPPATLQVTGQQRPLPAESDVAILRVGQEALTNIAKHAQAQMATLRLEYLSTHVALTVTDDGVGFAGQPHPSGYGLRGMRARVERLGGDLSIDSAPGLGTKITAELPC